MKLAVLALLAVVAACSGKAGDESSTGDKASAGKGADPWSGSADVPPPKLPDKVVVDDPGAEPRRVLAYVLAPHERRLDFQVDIAAMTLQWTCESGGRCRYRVLSFTVGKDNAFDALAKSNTGDATVGANGDLLVQPGSLVRLMPSPPDLLRLAIAPLPATAVGEGARWHLGTRAYRVMKLSPLELAVSVAQDDDKLDGALSIDLAQPIATAMNVGETVTVKPGPNEPYISPIKQTITLR